METASDLISVKGLRPVFKYLFTFFCALALGFIIYEIVFAFSDSASAVPLTICMLIGGYIGYFGSSMLLNKSFRVFKSWPGYLVSALVIIAVMACVNYDVLGIEKYIPDPAKVESVTIDCTYDNNVKLTEKDNIKKAEELHRFMIESGDDWADDYTYYYRITYELANGREIERQYNYRAPAGKDKTATLLDSVLNCQEAVENRLKTRFPLNEETLIYAQVNAWDDEHGEVFNGELSPGDAFELYETCVLPDVKDGNLGKVDVSSFNSKEYPNVELLFELNESKGSTYYGDLAFDYDTLYLRVTPRAERTWQYIREHLPEFDTPQAFGG
jgi:ABC-2 type transport system permease protein